MGGRERTAPVDWICHVQKHLRQTSDASDRSLRVLCAGGGSICSCSIDRTGYNIPRETAHGFLVIVFIFSATFTTEKLSHQFQPTTNRQKAKKRGGGEIFCQSILFLGVELVSLLAPLELLDRTSSVRPT